MHTYTHTHTHTHTHIHSHTYRLVLYIFYFISGETVRLARDFNFLCESDFPCKVSAEHNLRQNTMDTGDFPQRKSMLMATR